MKRNAGGGARLAGGGKSRAEGETARRNGRAARGKLPFPAAPRPAFSLQPALFDGQHAAAERHLNDFSASKSEGRARVNRLGAQFLNIHQLAETNFDETILKD